MHSIESFVNMATLQTSDVISLLAAALAALSALYARHAAAHARRANELTVQNALRPDRLAVFTALVEFLQYCSTYKTLQCVKAVTGTADLMTKLDIFKWEIAQRGPLNMPTVESVVREAITNAVQLQRLLDRSAAPDAMPINSAYASAEDNLDALLDWFAAKKREAPTLFEPYLKVT